MKRIRVLFAGLACVLLFSCTAAPDPIETSDAPTGLAASPYNYLPGLIEHAGGFKLFGEIDAPAVSIDPGFNLNPMPEWLGPVHTLMFNGDSLAYELTDDEPGDCLCPSLDYIGEHFDFVAEVEEPLRSGWMAIDMDVFWTIRSPTVLVEAIVLEGNGERTVGSTTYHFEYPWRQRVSFGVFADFAGVLPGELVGVRFTMIDSEPGPPQFVFNAGPGDRVSTVSLPVL